MHGVVIVIALFATALSGCGSDNASDRLAEQEKQTEGLERRLGAGEKSGSSTAPGSSTSESPGSVAPAAPASPTPSITGPRSSPATPPGYWKRCGDAPNATRVEHHDEDCSTAERIAGKYSRDDSDPEDWSCMSRRRGIAGAVDASPEAVVTCAKKPGTAVRVIRFLLSACPGAGRPASGGGSSRRTDDWPDVPAYTTIMASVGSGAEARRVQAAACDRGLAAGVLYSTNYAALKPGFWVVFSGTNAGVQEANRRTAEARSRGYPDAYTRFVR